MAEIIRSDRFADRIEIEVLIEPARVEVIRPRLIVETVISATPVDDAGDPLGPPEVERRAEELPIQTREVPADTRTFTFGTQGPARLVKPEVRKRIVKPEVRDAAGKIAEAAEYADPIPGVDDGVVLEAAVFGEPIDEQDYLAQILDEVRAAVAEPVPPTPLDLTL